MTDSAPHSSTWVDVQKKTFTRWSNNYLSERFMKLNNLEADISDGLLLINLLEILSAKTLPKHNKNPKIRSQKLENCSIALKFIQQERIKLVAIGAEDICDGQLKLILGLIWTLILRFQIQKGEGGSPKAELLEWVRKKVAPYDLRPNNFTSDWQSGKLLSALTDSLEPGKLTPHSPPNNWTGDAMKDVLAAMEAAETHYDIPKLMDPHDMVETPEELSIMTYVSLFRDYENEGAKKKRDAEERERQRKLKTADPSQCFAHGPGLKGGQAGQHCPFTIQAVNYFGDNLPTGGDAFQVEITGPETPQGTHDTPQCHIKDNGDGTYNCHYIPQRVGSYTISIKLRDEHIKDSPYGPAFILGASTQFSGFNEFTFTIQARDKHNNLKQIGGDVLTVEAPVEVHTTDNGNGTYTCRFSLPSAGKFEFNIFINGKPLSCGPLVLQRQ